MMALYNIKPHLEKTFKLSNDPHFIEKVPDIVGLYLSPPDKALVLSVNEKSQIQALDRTQPGLPIRKGSVGTVTRDYKRHDTTTLFAALNVLDGKVIGECMPKHRQEEFLKFLKRIEIETEQGMHVHFFTPTFASWLNMVERLFGEITTKKTRRGIFKSVKALETSIMDYVKKHNKNKRSINGRRTPTRFCLRLQSVKKC